MFHDIFGMETKKGCKSYTQTVETASVKKQIPDIFPIIFRVFSENLFFPL